MLSSHSSNAEAMHLQCDLWHLKADLDTSIRPPPPVPSSVGLTGRAASFTALPVGRCVALCWAKSEGL